MVPTAQIYYGMNGGHDCTHIHTVF